jgi:hypothetical protein
VDVSPGREEIPELNKLRTAFVRSDRHVAETVGMRMKGKDETKMKGKVPCSKPLKSNGLMTENISCMLLVIVRFEVRSSGSQII